MVLDTLGQSLKNTLKKLAQAVFVTDRLLDELTRDIQRALLQADVDVQLVFQLTKQIKERAQQEQPPGGISQREHLVTIVYQELVKFFGEEKKGIQITKKKPFKIMLLGLFGSGKCVHQDSKIPLSNGAIVSAEDLYSRYQRLEKTIEDGTIIDMQDQHLFVPSFNPTTLKIEHKKVTHLWKLHGKELLQVYLDNGNDFYVRVTPEHPFFILRDGELLQARADQLQEQDIIATPLQYSIEGEQQHLFNDLKHLDISVKNYHLDTSTLNIKKDIMPILTFPRNYCSLTQELKKDIVPISLVQTYSLDIITCKERKSKSFIAFPTLLTEELAEFLGYVLGDGHLGSNYVEISNEDREIIERVCSLSKKLFHLPVTQKKDKRSKSATFRQLIISSKTLVNILNKLFNIPIGKKGKSLDVPHKILLSQKPVIRAFLRAYGDCDGYAAKDCREIELCSESRIFSHTLASLLQRFGIFSSFSQRFIKGVPYSRLFLRARYAEIYASEIGFTVSHKKERAATYSIIGRAQGCGKQDMLFLGTSLRTLRHSLGYSIGEIQTSVTSYGLYEAQGRISRESLSRLVDLYSFKRIGNIATFLDAVYHKSAETIFDAPFINGILPLLNKSNLLVEHNGLLFLTRKAEAYLDALCTRQDLFHFFQLLATADVCWLPVKHIQRLPPVPYVYDLTVENNHSFIADNIIVHNTTTISKLANYYQKRGYKIAVVGLDVHRPAAPLQLKQLADQLKIPAFINPRENNALKIWKQFASEYHHYDILLIDTAGRDALNKELIQEIEAVGKAVQADERLLVLSADIGQAAKKQAQQFHDSCSVTGVIVTKLDGTAKGGGSLSACAATQAPIKFIGVGEKVDDLEEFNPSGFVGRLLGMGDIEALLEKAKEAMTEEEAVDLSKKMLEGQFTLLDLYEQLRAMRKMGPLSKIMEMIPGMGNMKLPKDTLHVQEEKITLWKYVMDSCTKEELEHPEILTKSRIERIAKGAGVQVKDVRDLLKQYHQSKKLMKMMKGKNPEKLMQQFGKMQMK